MNLSAVLLLFCKPIMDAPEKFLNQISPTYLRFSKVGFKWIKNKEEKKKEKKKRENNKKKNKQKKGLSSLLCQSSHFPNLWSQIVHIFHVLRRKNVGKRDEKPERSQKIDQ